MKICVVGAKLFNADRWTDRQTDITKLVVFAILWRHLTMCALGSQSRCCLSLHM